MNKRIEISVNQEDVQNIIDCYEKDIEYIKQLEAKVNQLETNIDEAIEYINKYAWQEDIIGDMYTTTGKPIVDRYMQLDWDSCNELLSLLERGKE